jgi:hypothetical protein
MRRGVTPGTAHHREEAKEAASDAWESVAEVLEGRLCLAVVAGHACSIVPDLPDTVFIALGDGPASVRPPHRAPCCAPRRARARAPRADAHARRPPDAAEAYEPFCADFGPINLGHTVRFVRALAATLLGAPRARVVCVVRRSREAVSNAVYLFGAFLTLALRAAPADTWRALARPGGRLAPLVAPFRDATWARAAHTVDARACWAALRRAAACGMLDLASFDTDE